MDHYGVIGNPIQHSLSPLIHRLFAAEVRQSLIFHPILVPLDGLPKALQDFRLQGGRGLSVTLPFKHRAFQLVDAHSERAKVANAINAIQFHDDGSSFGDNTDGVGLVRDITQNIKYPLHKKSILILGAGGAVRGILGPLLQSNPHEVTLVNRTISKARELASEFAELGPIQVEDMSKLKKNYFDLVINATSASLREEVIDLPNDILTDSPFCYDMVYGKGLTPFLCWAKEQNSQFADGLGMLVEQAAETFCLWRGVKPNVQPVLAALRHNISAIA